MPILAIIQGTINVDQYEELRRAVNWEKQHPPGAMLHAAAFDENGHLRAVDIWASEGEMAHFMAEKLAPAAEKLGIELPTVDTYPIQNLNGFPTLDKHVLQRH